MMNQANNKDKAMKVTTNSRWVAVVPVASLLISGISRYGEDRVNTALRGAISGRHPCQVVSNEGWEHKSWLAILKTSNEGHPRRTF